MKSCIKCPKCKHRMISVFKLRIIGETVYHSDRSYYGNYFGRMKAENLDIRYDTTMLDVTESPSFMGFKCKNCGYKFENTKEIIDYLKQRKIVNKLKGRDTN